MNILEKALNYLDTEHKDFRAFIARQAYAPSIPSKNDELNLIERTRKSTLDRGMGVVMFIQSLGVSYDDTKEPYEEFKDAINQLAEIGKRGVNL